MDTNNNISTETNLGDMTKPENTIKPSGNSNMVWVLLLVLVAFVVLGTMLYVFMRKGATTQNYNSSTNMTNEVQPNNTMMESDDNKDPSQVNDEVVREIDELDNEDMDQQYNDQVINELTQ
jgi:phosphopantothenoylcysteine synthetase/decarboxylase